MFLEMNTEHKDTKAKKGNLQYKNQSCKKIHDLTSNYSNLENC